MVELYSIVFLVVVVIFAPGMAIAGIWSALARGRTGLVDNPIELIVLSLSINILAAYLFFVFSVGSEFLFSIYAAIMLVLMTAALIFREDPPKIALSLPVVVLSAILLWRVLPDIGFPIMAWDAIQVWQAMADRMIIGEARFQTASYPHGLGALGAVAMATGSAIEGSLALRTLTLVLPVVALAAVLVYSDGLRRLAAGVFATIFILALLGGMDQISFKYSTSFTSDFFLFTATVISLLSIYKFAQEYEARPAWSWSVLWSPSYIIATLAIFVAANSKQTGLSYIVMPGLVALLFAPPEQSLFKRLLYAAALTIAPALLGGLWYVLALIREVGTSGGASLEFLLVGVHQGRDLLERAQLAVTQMASLLPIWLWLLCAVAAIGGVLSRRGVLTLVTMLPTFLFYLFVSGYATRNATGVIAGIFILSLLGLFRLADWIEQRLQGAGPSPFSGSAIMRGVTVGEVRIDPRALMILIAVGVLSVGVTNGNHISAYLEAQHVRGGPEIGFRGINTRLLRNSPDVEGRSMLLVTNYRVADRIPQLSRFRIANVATRPEAVRGAIEAEADDFVLFLIWPDRTSDAFQGYLRCLIGLESSEDLGTVWEGSGTQYVHLRVKVDQARSCSPPPV